MLSLFYATVPKYHAHTVLDVFPHGAESKNDWFKNLEHTSFLDLGSTSLTEKISKVRDHQFDVVIDLSGWTSNHFLRGFMERLAPVQVSYLGYFASTGLNTMDYWLGDHSLFPQPITEWHTETIYRLNRCFISWSPPPYLPEASAEVVDTPASGGIRFGCFNHHRKFSDETLNVWGQILSSIPDSRLVLKGGQSDDSATSTLLSRRMRRAGLDPEKIIWIERTRGTSEHLKQYELIDITLDSFPNGGCTTSCESLWMGVPVITHSGTSYVNRMSTAVLQGAGLSDWCCSSLAEYVSLAREHASNLSSLRQNRVHWRELFKSTDLGNPQSLDSIEESFL